MSVIWIILAYIIALMGVLWIANFALLYTEGTSFYIAAAGIGVVIGGIVIGSFRIFFK